ncbi:DUF2312 domain-containing protein [Agrobacterium vitis]|nr:DUF2312 domain-containing protein [Agrobacterium vitis]
MAVAGPITTTNRKAPNRPKEPEPDEHTVSIRLADGTSTGEVSLSTIKEALALVEDENVGNGLNVAAEELRQFVKRIERINEELGCLNDDKKDVYGEAKGRGYCTKTIKRVIAARAKDASERLEEDSLYQTYMTALGEDV